MKRNKIIIALLLALLITATTNLIVTASDDIETVLGYDLADTLRNMGIVVENIESEASHGIAPNSFDSTEVRAGRHITSTMPRLAKSYESLTVIISTEADVQVLLAVMDKVGELSDSSVFIDDEIVSAINEAGLLDLWDRGLHELSADARVRSLTRLAENMSIDELFSFGLIDGSRPEILNEFRELGLLEEFFANETDNDGYIGISPMNWHLVSRRNTPRNLVFRAGDYWTSGFLKLPGERIDMAVWMHGSPNRDFQIGLFEPFTGTIRFARHASVTWTTTATSGTVWVRHNESLFDLWNAGSTSATLEDGFYDIYFWHEPPGVWV